MTWVKGRHLDQSLEAMVVDCEWSGVTLRTVGRDKGLILKD